jgi:organic radical activating enzyme
VEPEKREKITGKMTIDPLSPEEVERGEKIPVVEIFYSLQGEGMRIGTPSLFLRTGGCNLRCPNLPCDTPYAVLPPYSLHWEEMEIAQIWQKFTPYLHLSPDLVITGGEPLLHWQKLSPLIQKYPYPITIETNGTISPNFREAPFYKRVIFAISPKLSNSGERKQKRFKPEIIRKIGKFAPNSFFKFVLSPANLSQLEGEIEEIVQFAPHLPIYCMPQGENREELEKNGGIVAQFALSKGYRYSDRLHLRLFPPVRGV